MPMDKVIRAIKKTGSENIQDLIDAAFRRYKELFPDWEKEYFSVKKPGRKGRERGYEVA